MRGVLSRSKTAVSVIPLALAEEGFISRLPQRVAAVFSCFRHVLERSGLPDVDILLPLVEDNGQVYSLQQIEDATALFYFQQISQIVGKI
jgi:hypothetical protein